MKTYVAGHKALVGSAICRRLEMLGRYDILTRSRAELDLLQKDAVFDFFRTEKPEWVFLAAAKVGGIHANSVYPVEFLLENLHIQNNVIEGAFRSGVKKLLFLGSSCIYPRLSPQPIREEFLLSSELESTNEAYAIAKIAGIKLCKYFNKEYCANYISVMPANLYGPNDNYHGQNAHALPMLIRRFHEAKLAGLNEVVVWGTGKPRREFLFVDDLADACVYLMENGSAEEIGDLINIGTGEDCTIQDLAVMIKEIVGFRGELLYDVSKPDGTPQKLLDVSKINALGWKARTSLNEGLQMTYQDFLTNITLRK